MAALIWALPWLGVPSQLAMGSLLALVVLLAVNGLRSQEPPALALALLAVAAIGIYVAEVLWSERGALRVTERVTREGVLPERIRLVDFNVLHGYPRFPSQAERADLTVAALGALEPDVLVLQEAWRTRAHGDLVERLGAELGMDSAFARANGSLRRLGFEEGEAVLSRFPILQAERIPLEPRRPFYERRVALLCTLDLGGEHLTVVGVHLDNRSLDTASGQAASLAHRLRGVAGPIVAGDFNAVDGSPPVVALGALGLRDLVPGGIDHVLFPERSSWRVESAGWTLQPAHLATLIGRSAEISDHPGLVVDLVRAVLPANEGVR